MTKNSAQGAVTGKKSSFFPNADDNIFPPKLAPGAGKKIQLLSNHFELSPGNKLIYRYDVSVVQTINEERGERQIDWCRKTGDSVKRNERHSVSFMLMQKANEMMEFSSRKTVIVYDNSRTLFSCEKLREDLCARVVIKGDDLPEEFRDDRRKFRGEYSVSIVPVTKRAHAFKGNDLAKAVERNQDDHSLRQFWEILTNQKAIADEKHTVFYGTLYDKNPTPERMKQLNDSCHIVFGVTKGTRIIGDDVNSMKAAVVLDSQKAVFYDTSGTTGLVGNVKTLLGKNDTVLSPADKMKIEKHYKDVTLIHLYTKHEFKFTKLDDMPVSNVKFTERSNRTISVVDYHSEKFDDQGFSMEKPGWPGVVREIGRDGKTAVYPMEVLGIKEGQQVPFSKLTPMHTQALLKEAKDPKRRFEEIKESLNVLDLGPTNEYLQEHGVHINDKPMKVTAHIQDLPSVEYKDGAQPVKWTAKWESKKFIVPAKIDKFILISNEQCMNKAEVGKFAVAFLAECRAKGMSIPNATITAMPKDVHGLRKKLQDEDREMEKNHKVTFVMFIDSEKNKSHSALKYLEAFTQVLTQQITSETALKPFLKQTVANIVAKTNQKCFGQNYKINFKSNFISTSEDLIIAYDVCHPTGASAPARQNGIFETLPSVVGFAFNGATHPDSFIGDYAYQSARQERVEMLRSTIPWMLRLFEKNRNKRPERIVVIRDGVSEGQFRMVLESEVMDIRKGCNDYAAGYKPKLMVVTVTKRHEKRFFVLKNDGSIHNPSPGTIVDCTVTRPDMTEFFMQPHSVPQGTAKMPAYSLLLNEFGTPKGDNTTKWLVDFLIGLCCSHQIITSAISIPEPVFQADEWAKRGDANFRFFKNLQNNEGKYLIEEYLGQVNDPRYPGQTMLGFRWPDITKRLRYRGRRLEGTRANA